MRSLLEYVGQAPGDLSILKIMQKEFIDNPPQLNWLPDSEYCSKSYDYGSEIEKKSIGIYSALIQKIFSKLDFRSAMLPV